MMTEHFLREKLKNAYKKLECDFFLLPLQRNFGFPSDG